MKRRSGGLPGAGLRTAALLAALAWAIAGCSGPPPASERNVILVTLDTTRADRIGAFGGNAVPTPHLDRAARRGVRFQEAISQVPLTLPSHSSILTGRYPAAHGVRHNGIYRLREAETTLAEVFAGAGYHTAAVIAAYVLNRGFGTEQGFETYDDVPVNRYQGGRDQVFEAQRTGDQVNAAALSWLDHRPEGKFFLWVHYYDPHEPYSPPESPERRLQGTGYDREISYLDACFGDLMNALRKRGLLDRSILVVVGDHGESLGEHGERTHGLFVYRADLHVPLFIRAPGLVPDGREVTRPVELVDIAPTVLKLVGLPAPNRVQGHSLLPWIRGKAGSDAAPVEVHAETLMPMLEFGWAPLRMVRDSRFKYIQAPTPELYDLREDPGATRNLAPMEPERVADMESVLNEWVARSTNVEAQREAGRTLNPEEEARLRSLGYLGGDAFKTGGTAGRMDPKDGIRELKRLDAARDLLAAGDAAGALRKAGEVLRENPGNHQARTTRIMALIDLGRLPEAEKEAMAALAAAESDVDVSAVLVGKARGLLASTLRLQGKNDRAERQYRAILRADPANESAAVDLGRLLIEQRRLEEARPILEEVLRRNPRDGMAMAALFLLEQQAGNREAAIRLARRLAEGRAGDAPVLVRAGRLLFAEGFPAEAAECFSGALEQMAPNARLLGELGQAQMAARKVDDARESFLAAARLEPRDPRPYYFLGTISLEQGDESRARSYFGQAVSLRPTFTRPLVVMGRWLASRGRKEEAAAAFREALRRNPSDPDAGKELRALEQAAPPIP